MDLKNFGGLIGGLVITIILLTSLLIPIVNASSNGEVTYVNEGIRMSPVGDQTITITYDSGVWTVNDVDVGYELGPISQGTIMLYSTASSTRAGYLYTSHDDTYSRTSIANTSTETVEYVGAEKVANITTVSNGNTYTASYSYVEEIYYLDANGDYAWFSEKPTTAYIPDDWDKFNTWSVNADHFYAIIGNTIMVDGTESPEGVTYSMELGNIPGITGVKTIDSYTLNIPDQDPISCRGYILPYQVTGINSNEQKTHDMLEIIPLLVTVGIILAIVGWAFTRRE